MKANSVQTSARAESQNSDIPSFMVVVVVMLLNYHINNVITGWEIAGR